MPEPGRAGALARYLLLWTVAAAIVVLIAVGVIRALDGRGGAEDVAPPPPTSVLVAGDAAGCSFSRIDRPAVRATALLERFYDRGQG